MKINYQRMLDETIYEINKSDKIPKLLLHSCCAPCSSYVLEYLSNYFNIIVYFYNPNIYPEDEFFRRVDEQKRFINSISVKNPISFVEGDYITEDFYSIIKGLENEIEGGKRCFECYKLRLYESALKAKELGADYFTTTLTISPHKNAQKLNELGKEIENELNIKYLYSDFKKKEGYKRSIVLSQEYNLYRQDYCGCVFSKNNKREVD